MWRPKTLRTSDAFVVDTQYTLNVVLTSGANHVPAVAFLTAPIWVVRVETGLGGGEVDEVVGFRHDAARLAREPDQGDSPTSSGETSAETTSPERLPLSKRARRRP